ncbi:integrating conjugative element protein [Striga asiatica]|uniref:Integrating conjugative element protein n=1 Tax=Striga asiatica TaxID=4170 RepID=A0A5A7PSL1_STRAF|nr:integrating conjugative element protein [Striga asiatica]
MTNFCSDPLPEEFRSDPKLAADTQSPTGVMESETGEWLKVISIDLADEKWKFDRFLRDSDENLGWLGEVFWFVPVGWLDYPDVLVFHPPPKNRSCIVYKVRTREIDSFELSTWVGNYTFRFHKSSLLSVG